MFRNVDYLQKEIDKAQYWDMPVRLMQINHFGDEVVVVIDSGVEDNVCLKMVFSICSKVEYETDASWNEGNWRGKLKVKDMKPSQLSYAAQNILIGKSPRLDKYYLVNMDLDAVQLCIECRDIQIEKVLDV